MRSIVEIGVLLFYCLSGYAQALSPQPASRFLKAVPANGQWTAREIEHRYKKFDAVFEGILFPDESPKSSLDFSTLTFSLCSKEARCKL